MSFNSNYYSKYAKNIFSQNGDDGILEKLLIDLKIKSGIVVEFGAWDGIYLSNVYNTWKTKNFKAILIEGESQRCNEMKNMFSSIDKVECIESYVSSNANDENSLDNILSRSKFKVTNNNLAVVSIDVDSFDYYIFESLNKFLPKIVIIETRSFPEGTSIYHEHITRDQGCSIKSVKDLGESKGYKLVCHNGNAFFVRNDLTHLLPEESKFNLENLHSSDSDVDIWQSVDNTGNLLENSRYYLTPQYANNLAEEKKLYLN